MRIDPEFAGLIPPLAQDEFAQLEANILEHGGARDALIVWQGILVDGHNRYKICTDHGLPFTTSDLDLENRSKVIEWIIRHQFGRRNLAPFARCELALRLESEIRERAKANQVASGEQFGKGLQKSAEPIVSIDTRQELASLAGVSHDTITKAKKITEAVASGQVEPQVVEQLRRGDTTVNKVVTDLQREQKRVAIVERLKAVTEAEADAPTGLYDVIVMDPPWPMQKIERDVRPNQSEFDYPTMSEDELSELEIPAAEDCHLWLWTTHKFLPMAIRLLDGWGFKYVCTFVWHKPGGFQPIGLPQYNCEFAIYARKGTPQFVDTKAFPVCFEAPRGAHSEKPEAFYDVIRRVTVGRRLDMFNRRAIEGFAGWGNESP